MANHYSRMAIMLGGTAEELGWLEALITALEIGSEDMPEDILNVVNALKEESFLGVSADLYPTGGKDGAPALHVYADESFNPDLLAAALQAWLVRFDIAKEVQFEWAAYCSKAAPLEFGGGACIVRRHEIVWMTTSEWLSMMNGFITRGEPVKTGNKPQDAMTAAVYRLFNTPDTVEINWRYTCRHCGREWSAMSSEDEIPLMCPSDDCPGNIARLVISHNMPKEG